MGVSVDKIAVLVVCPIVAKHDERNEMIIYGGAIHFTKDTYTDNADGLSKVAAVPSNFGIRGWNGLNPNIYLKKTSQEHGIVFCKNKETYNKYEIGDLIGFYPAHSCLTADNFDILIDLSGNIVHKFKY